MAEQEAAILVNCLNGEVMFEQNSDKQIYPASTTKIMTAAVALKYGNLSDVIEVSATAAGVEGSSMYLECGEKITLENCQVLRLKILGYIQQRNGRNLS